MSKNSVFLILVFLALWLTACGILAPEPVVEVQTVVVEVTPMPQPTAEPIEVEEPLVAEEPVVSNDPVQLAGDIEVSNAMILEIYYYERFAMLEDLTGFIQRDYEYEQPLEGQILGPVRVDEEGDFSYTLNLPSQPVSPYNDVDNDDEADQGVQVWQVAMNANYIDDPFLGDDETGGWSGSYTSAKLDAENKYEIKGGMILVWAADDQQKFPTSFGADGLLFTEDDPVDAIPAGYSIVDLDSKPFKFINEPVVNVPLYEGDISVNDYSEMGWAEAFETLHNKVSVEYPFTERKNIDWDALYEDTMPRIEDAESNGDEEAYHRALRDYTWSIPDGHVGLSYSQADNDAFETETEGGYGLAITGLDDGSVIVNILSEEGPAAEAGLLWGAEILEWNGVPINEALDQVVPWSMPFSSEIAKRIQQYRYLLRAPLDTQAVVTFINPGIDVSTTVTMTSIVEPDTFTATSIYAGFDTNSLPVEYEFLPSGFGYIKINSLSDDINLIIRLWEWAIERMITEGVPGIIVDLRQNAGGSPLGEGLASYFTQERIDTGRSYYYSDESGEFETYGPPNYIEPDKELYYGNQLAVLVGPACASACENVAYVLGQLPQTRVFGFYPSSGMYGEVGRGQYNLPGNYGFQAPTGMDLDMEGNVIIEGTGVVPDMPVPLTVENLQAQYVDDQDVVLDFAIDTLINVPPGVGVVPEHPPKVGTINEAETAFQNATEWLEDVALETYGEDEISQAGRVYTYTIPLIASKDLIWLYAWCTVNQESFDDNWSKIELEFSINDEIIPQSKFALLEGIFSGQYCRAYYTVLSDWAYGENIVRTTVTFTESLNDGLTAEDYPAGTHTYEYHVTVAQ
jgi:C-terminal processing protease CtpA/Prc